MATIYDENGTYLADGDFSQTEGGPATITLQAPGNGCQFYQTVGSHAVYAYYYVNNYYIPNLGNRNGYYDVDNYTSFQEVPNYNPFVDSYYFYGSGPTRIIENDFISLGVTEVSGSGNCSPPPTITAITPPRGGLENETHITITGTRFLAGHTSLNISGTGVSVVSDSLHVSSPSSLTADLRVEPTAAGGNRLVKVSVNGVLSDAGKNFLVQIPTNLVPKPSPTPGLVTLDPTPGKVINGGGGEEFGGANRCGAYRNYGYLLKDQNGDTIETSLEVTEILTNFQVTPTGAASAPQAQVGETQGGVLWDLHSYTTAAPCPGPPTFSASINQAFKVVVGLGDSERTFNLTTTNTITASRNGSGVYSIMVTNTLQ